MSKWKVVPSVCTDQMNLAGWKKRPFYSEETYAVIYAAMLDAAPTEGAPVLIDAEELAGLRRDAERYQLLRIWNIRASWPHELDRQGLRAPAGLIAWGGTRSELDKRLDDALGFLPHHDPLARADYQQYMAAETSRRMKAADSAIAALAASKEGT